MNKYINKYFKLSILLVACSVAPLAFGQSLRARENAKVTAKISKAGLNRISSPPYQILQVTGDESAFRLKSDPDGANIYIMPLKKTGEKIEISIKNSAGTTHDMELEVAPIPGQSICVTSNKAKDPNDKTDKANIVQMLKCMQDDKNDKFYVQDTRKSLDAIGDLTLTQTKLYRWKDLSGGVFLVTNNTRKTLELNLLDLTSRFDNVLTSFASKTHVAPYDSVRVFIIQKSN